MTTTAFAPTLLEKLMLESQANSSVPMEESPQLYLDATRNLVVEVKKEKVEQERLQNELAQRPKILASGDFRLHDNQVRAYSIEGVLNKKETKSAAWQKYFFRFLPNTLELVYYPSRDDYLKGRAGSIIPVSWVWSQKAEEEDGLMQKQVQFSLVRKTKVEVCIWRTSVYSPRRTYILSAQNDSEMQKWVHNITAVLSLMLSTQEMANRTEAAQKLTPLLINQLKMEKEQYKLIVQSLQTAGIFPDRPTGKRREGYLEMQKADGSWKKYYFVLFKESLSYFNLDDKVLLPRGVVLLESISSIRKITRSKSNTPPSMHSPSKSPPTALLQEYGIAPMDIEPVSTKKDDKLPKQQFEILTPLRTYTLRAKHAEAMRDWSIAIQQMIGADKLPLDSSIAERNPDDISGEPVLGPKYFSLNVGGKSKKIAMKKENVVLGRSTKSDVVVTDGKVSRNHCRIELTPTGVPILYDLGSLGGTYVNGKRVIKHALKPGDKITIGTADILFTADALKAK